MRHPCVRRPGGMIALPILTPPHVHYEQASAPFSEAGQTVDALGRLEPISKLKDETLLAFM
jgi:hypothetical protein